MYISLSLLQVTVHMYLILHVVTGAMDSANLDEKKVAELIDEKMKDLQIRREKIFPYPVEEIKFLEILQSKLYTDIL